MSSHYIVEKEDALVDGPQQLIFSEV